MDEIFNRKLTGAQKTAIILLSVDEQHATKLFAQLNEDEIKEISAAMSSLGAISSELIEQTVSEFNTEMSNSVSFIGNVDTTEKLLSKILDKEQVTLIMDEIRGPAGKNTWDKLGNISEDLLAGYLKNEYPQTIALIISKLAPAQAAKVFSALPDNITLEVMMRMLSMEPVKKEVLDRVEKILKTEFISAIAKTQKYDSNEAMAEIFNNFDRNNEAKFMGMLEGQLPEYAEKIKNLMFTFNDLNKINMEGIQTLMRSVVDKQQLNIALKGASEEIKNLFIGSMSQRAAKILIDEIQEMAPVKMKDVDKAQGMIVAMARDMAAKGIIQISKGNDDEDDQLIY